MRTRSASGDIRFPVHDEDARGRVPKPESQRIQFIGVGVCGQFRQVDDLRIHRHPLPVDPDLARALQHGLAASPGSLIAGLNRMVFSRFGAKAARW